MVGYMNQSLANLIEQYRQNGDLSYREVDDEDFDEFMIDFKDKL